MDREDLDYLQYITPVDNLPSIQAHGLLSHNRAQRHRNRSVANAEVQERRRAKRVPRGFRLHDYVNLYFNARNTMMYEVTCRIPTAELCVVCVATDVLDLRDVVVTDCNAASDYARFRPSPAGLTVLDHAELFAESWQHQDAMKTYRHRSRMCAEVLVPHMVPPNFLLGGYVVSQDVADGLASAGITLPLAMRPYLFFR